MNGTETLPRPDDQAAGPGPEAAVNPPNPAETDYVTPFPSPVAGMPPLRFPRSLFERGAESGDPSPDPGPDAAPDVSPSPDVLTNDEVDALREETEQDAWDRFNDAELLGKSFRVRRVIQETGTQTIRGWRHMGAKVRNAFATPGKAVKQFAFNRAKSSYDRKAARHAGATSERVLEIVSSAKTKMDRRQAKLERHTQEMQGRVLTVNEDMKVRRQEYTNQLKIRKEDILSKKAVRVHLRDQGVGRIESRRMAKAEWEKMSIDFRHRVGGNAIAREATRLKSVEAERAASKATGRETKAKERRDSAKGRAKDYFDAWTEAQNSIVNINGNLLKNARIRVGSLEDRLSGLDESDPQYAEVSSELASANADIANLNAELTQWQAAAERAHTQHNTATDREADRQQAYDRLHGQATQAADQSEMWSRTHGEDQARLHESLEDALRPKDEAEKEN